MAEIILLPGREKSLLRRHPWVFSGAVSQIIGAPQDGETVIVRSAKGEFLARAAYSSRSQIIARVWSWEEDEEIDAHFFHERLLRSFTLRHSWPERNQTNALRLVHAESDGLPGLIVDQYGEVLVVQFLSCGAEYWKSTIVELLWSLTGAESIYERSDVEVRKLEGLSERRGVLIGNEPPEKIKIYEDSRLYWVDIHRGQKTGFYLDQRANRRRVGGLGRDREVLDCFCYTGGFSLALLSQGAPSIMAVDASAEAVALGRENLVLNEISSEWVDWVVGDVFRVLRDLRDRGRKFDLIVLDPPKFAATATQVPRALRGYKDINLLAFKLLRPGGILATFSCSGGVDLPLFQKVVAGAAQDARVDARVVDTLTQDWDHPVGLNFPEGSYLKGLILQV